MPYIITFASWKIIGQKGDRKQPFWNYFGRKKRKMLLWIVQQVYTRLDIDIKVVAILIIIIIYYIIIIMGEKSKRITARPADLQDCSSMYVGKQEICSSSYGLTITQFDESKNKRFAAHPADSQYYSLMGEKSKRIAARLADLQDCSSMYVGQQEICSSSYGLTITQFDESETKRFAACPVDSQYCSLMGEKSKRFTASPVDSQSSAV